MYEKVESFVAGCRPPRLGAGAKFAIALVALAALCSCAVAEEDIADYWLETGNDLFMNGSYEKAILAYENVLQIDPNSSEAWSGKGDALSILGKYNESIQAYDNAIEINPNDANLWNMKGQALADLGKYEEAIDAFGRATELSPQDEFMWMSKGVILANVMSRYDEAVEAYDRALQIDPENVDVWTLKGDALRNLGEYEDCIEAYDKVIEIDQKGAYAAHAWYGKGLALQAIGRTSDADAAFAKAEELGYVVPPASSLSITNVISVGEDEFIEMANDGNETQTFMGLALTIDEKESVVLPDFTLDPGERIRFHFGGGESNETDVFLDGDLALDDVAGNLTLKDTAGTLEKFAAYWTPEETSEYWTEKGRKLQRNESYEDALDALNNATDIDPQNAMAWLTKANILGPNLGRYNESLEACDKALQINPDDADAWRLKGLILMNLGRPTEESLAAFDEAIELDPQNGFTWYLKGNSLQYLGHETEAEAAFAKAEELGYTSPLAGMLAITNITATGEDEFVEISNNLEDANNLGGWTLVIDESETLRLSDFTLEPGKSVQIHLGKGNDTETDLFMKSEISLNDTAPNASLRDESGNEICSLGFEEKTDGGVVVSKHCVSEV